MVRWRRQGLAWLVLAIYLLPAPALAQSTKVGVVTTLEGNVTAVRVVAPQPVALKFKDDVFLQDRVVTGEQAFARLLLGGKAVISIRERSAVTITEFAGRSTVEIESGKIALSIARERMLPGEVVNIKTPNAIAGVRGTVVVAQVTYRQGQPFTNLWVLRGIIDAIHTDVTGAPLSQPVPVGEKESFNADQATATKGTFTLEEVDTIVQGLQPQRTQDVGSASQSPARLEAVNTAVALLGALVGPGGQQQLALLTGPPLPIPAPQTTPEQTVTVAPITSLSNPVTEQVLSDQQKCSQGNAAACTALGLPPVTQPPSPVAPPKPPDDTDTNSKELSLFASPTTPTAPPLLPDPDPNPVTGQPSGLQFGQQRPLQQNGGGPLLEASNGAFVNVGGPNGNVLRLDTALLDATAPLIALTGNGTRLQTSGDGIDLANNARLQSTNAREALIRLENQARMDVLNGHLVSVSASRLNVAGDLVRMGNTSLLNVNGVLLNVLNGGVVNINGALVSFTGINAAINVTNTCTPTTFIAGIPVSIALGANVSIGAGALTGLNSNGNIIRINGTPLPTGATAASGITGSLINVGANGTVRIVGTPN